MVLRVRIARVLYSTLMDSTNGLIVSMLGNDVVNNVAILSRRAAGMLPVLLRAPPSKHNLCFPVGRAIHHEPFVWGSLAFFL